MKEKRKRNKNLTGLQVYSIRFDAETYKILQKTLGTYKAAPYVRQAVVEQMKRDGYQMKQPTDRRNAV
jgi:hypothetical protein